MRGTPSQAVAEQARLAGFGTVARTHREHRDVSVAAGVLMVALLPVAITTLIRALHYAPNWRVLPLVEVALALGVYLWAQLGPVAQRRWYAVAQGGLVIWSPRARSRCESRPPAAAVIS
jgi:hypothetical protein